MWARRNYDPIKAFEAKYCGMITHEEMKEVKKEITSVVRAAVKYADLASFPPANLAKELEYPTPMDTDFNKVPPPISIHFI